MERKIPGRGWRCALLATLLLMAAGARAEEPVKPTLVIAISVDQFSAHLFAEWRPRFTGGFARLMREGIVYPSAFQSHAMTETCPGHSTLLTGRHPSGTGIVANTWHDLASGKSITCTTDPSRRAAHDPAKRGDGPSLLVASTLGDWLKSQSPDSRVIAVAGKARSALMMGGHRTDAAFWFDNSTGFTTGLAEGESAEERLAPVAAVNEQLRAATPVWNYFDESCRVHEATYQFGATEWRSALPPSNWTGKLQDLGYSPFVDGYTLQLATGFLDRYELGRRGVTDLLTIGLSGTDYIGHRFGSRGPEMCDQLRRLDAALGVFLAEVEKRGVRPLVVLVADHGGSDFPERLVQNGYAGAGRVDSDAWIATLNATLMEKLKLTSKPLAAPDPHQLYLVDADGHALQGKARERVLAATLELVQAAPFVAAAFDAAKVLRSPKPPHELPADQWSFEQRQRETLFAGRTGDVLVVYQPYVNPWSARPGRALAGHGSIYDYDRRIPLLFWGPSIPAGERFLPVDTVDIAPTIANAIGVAVPVDLDGRCIDVRTDGERCTKVR